MTTKKKNADSRADRRGRRLHRLSVTALLRGTAESLRVQSGRVLRQDLTQTVSANGEIKPKKYVNISSNMMGRIVHMPVKEGDHVREGELLIHLESIQTEADVQFRAGEPGCGAGGTRRHGRFDSIRGGRRSILRKRRSLEPKPISLARSRTSIEQSE